LRFLLVAFARFEQSAFVDFALSISFVHIPEGPRKSGIPAEVEMPAPVKTTMCFAALTISNNFVIFKVILRSVSTCSGNPHTPLFLYLDKREAYDPDMMVGC
jgi:hypothetical protein